MSEAPYGGIQPEEALALAHAIALRAGQSAVIGERILAGLRAIPYEAPSPEQLQKAHLGRTVLYLAKVESPDAPLSWVEMVDAAQADGGYERTARMLSEITGTRVEAENARAVIHASMGEIRDGSGMSDEALTKDFNKILATAKEVAAEHRTDVATVYATDELYYETCRRAFTAAEMADKLSLIADSYSADMLNKFMVRQFENMIPKELLDEFDSQELAEIVAEMQLDPEIQADLSEDAELYKETVRQTGAYLFTRIYGTDSMKSLSTAHRLALTPRKPLVTEVLDKLD